MMSSIQSSEQVGAINDETQIAESELENSLLHLLQKRWSPRGFSDEPLSSETINRIFDAGRQVPSSYNEQPWRFVITDKGSEGYVRLFQCLTELNKKWVHTAPHLGVVLGKKYFSHKDKENPHRFYDCGAFMAIASLRAATLNIYIHQMAGFSTDQLEECFDFPDDFVPITMFVIGKLGDADQLPQQLQDKENPHSDRNSVFTFLFSDKWGAPY